jgi:hypothetical protein
VGSICHHAATSDGTYLQAKPDPGRKHENQHDLVEADASFRLSKTTGCTGVCGPGGIWAIHTVAGGGSGQTIDARYAIHDHFGP